ncbi:MAG: helix-turn-helix transcriptional regulator [Clostridia bacterium]|nr:helix-turn-helix transcriptional regulator [Clostridia bacterium]MBR6517135.1 helix-turn-helix transcriptional regulator [Bacilli bacterium]
MTLYQKKRVQNNIKRVDMARMLGLDYNYYCAIEKGEIKMPMNLIDKFSEIINRGKENKIDEINNKLEADKFWEQMNAKDETGRFELVNKMHEFNINNYKELVAVLGYKSVGTIYNYLEGRNPVGDEFKKRLYNFFSDETNIQIPKKSAKVKRATYKIMNEPRQANPELDEYYEKTDFKKIMRENEITNVQIADAIGVHNSTVSNMTVKKYKPSYRVIQLVKDYLSDKVTIDPIRDNTDYISKQKILSDCETMIENNRIKVEELKRRIVEIENDIELTTKVMEIISRF